LNAIQALYQLSYGPIWFGNLVQTDRVVGSTEPIRGPRIDVSAEGIKTGVAAALQQALSAVSSIRHFLPNKVSETQKARPYHLMRREQALFIAWHPPKAAQALSLSGGRRHHRLDREYRPDRRR
jgi:hypothetical protein